MKHGIKYPLEPITEEDRLLHLNLNLERGNYPIRDEESIGKIEEFVQTELSHGFLLPILKSKVTELEGAEAYLVHIVKQLTINEAGDEALKYRPCHNLSYSLKGIDNLSINKRYKTDKLEVIQYSFTFQRLLHFIYTLRVKYPSTPILI